MKKDKFTASAAKYPAIKIAVAVGGLFVIVFTALMLLGPTQARDVIEQILSAEPESEVYEGNQEVDLPPVDEESVIIEKKDFTVVVIGFEPMTDSICLAIRLEQVPVSRLYPGFDEDSDPGPVSKRVDDSLKQIHLIDQTGQKYRYQDGNFVSEHFYCTGCATGVVWSSEVLLELPELSDQAQTLTLVVPLSGDEELKKEFSLASLQEVGECRLPGVRITW